VADRDLRARLPEVELADLTRSIHGPLKRPRRRREQRPHLTQVIIDDRLAAIKPSGEISSRIRWPGSFESAFSSRWISSLNGSSFDPTGARRYAGGSSLRTARSTVSLASPVRRLISPFDKPRTKCSRRITAHCSTSTTRSSRARSAHTSPGSEGHRTSLRWPTFERRSWPSLHPAPTTYAAPRWRVRDDRTVADYGSVKCRDPDVIPCAGIL
jgi:hypothetical protein